MRTLGGTTTTQFASANAGPVVLFVQMNLSTTLRLNSSAVTINHGGNDWLGTGLLGSVEEVAESTAEYKPLRFTLSGVPSTLIASALTEDLKNKDCTLSLCVLDASTHAVLEVLAVWAGKLDQMPIRLGNDGTCSIGVTAEHAGTTYARPKPLRYTDADQQRLFPGDTCLRFVVSQAQKQDVWPAASFFKV